MEHKQRAKMPASQRAKQFMPFAAVKGLEKAIAEQEQQLNHLEQIELDEELTLTINHELNHLEKGDKVSVCYYKAGQYHTLKDAVEQIDIVRGFVRIRKTAIDFESIINIKYLPQLQTQK